jgi:tol-pal system protein YbgF
MRGDTRHAGRAAGSILAAVLLFSVSSCARADSTERAIEQLRADLTRVSADRDRLEERVSALETTEQKRTEAEAHPEPSAPSPVESPPSHPAVVRGGPEVRPADLDASRAPRPSGDAKHDFEAAMALVRAKQYDKAADALTAFLVRYPDHEYADQAMYFRGDCFYAKGANARAAEQLQGLIARFPLSSRVPDALLKIGLSQRRIGAEDQAQRTFAELKERFPKSDAVRQVPHP